MNTSNNNQAVGTNRRKTSITRLAVVIALAGFSLAVHAGKITSIPSVTVPGVQDGFGGLNFDNLDVVLDGALGDPSTFDPVTGAYSFSHSSDLSYVTNIYEDDSKNPLGLMGHILAKPFPIGEPAGIKIVNDDFDVKEGKPTNCIMSTSYLDGHFLDEADPQQVLCSGPFQSHKRYKEPMLPSTVVDGIGNEKSLDLVFNVEAETGSRDYQVFQKINNWTDGRLEGFTIEVGFGTGTAFTPASAIPEVGVANLSLSVPVAVWDRADQNANFSTGLFGPKDVKHDRPPGFFDPKTRAGFVFNEYGAGNTGDASGQIDKLTSGATLGSDYAEVPAGAAVSYQFGKWLPNNMLPYGIFFDNDGNPDTDADLVAWYGYNPNLTPTPGFGWMKGSADSFAVYPNAEISALGADPLYSMGVIDDLVNVGLNYIVTVGDVSAFPGGKFTIHITPKIADPAMPAPGYVAVGVPPVIPVFTSSDAIITLTPSPEFVPGSLLTTRVGDADLNQDPLAVETTTVDVTTNNNSVAKYTLTLIELGPNRGVFVGNLPEEFSNVDVGTIVTVTYNDAAATSPGDITASSTAVASLPAGLLQFNPASYTVAENGGSVTVTVERSGGSTGAVSVEYNTKSGTAIGNEDFVPDTATLFFAEGVTTQTIQLGILYDLVAESDESFSVILSDAVGGATIGAASSAEIVITDVAPPVIPPVTPTSSSDGGGWCSYNPNGRFDPILPGMILAALAYLGWRLKKRA